MNIKLENELIKKYPTVFKDHGNPSRETCMTWGCECGDGWYNIIDELSSKLEPMGVVALQVKEKFGGLRFYVGNVTDEHKTEVFNIISEAESKSFSTCETCGESGKARRSGWIKTLCDKCANERSKGPGYGKP